MNSLGSNHMEHIMVAGIQRFSLHAGPGIRTVVFFKGCPMRCSWCCNPEMYILKQETCLMSKACIGVRRCGDCLDICPRGALYRNGDNAVGLDRELCEHCGKCAEVCPSQALSLCGTPLSVKDILRSVEMDIDFCITGGVTLSGGEPLMQMKGAAALLEELRQRQIHTAIETCGFFDMDSPSTRRALQAVQLVYYDVKHIDPVEHARGTGIENTRILHNLKRLCAEYPSLPIITRTPVIPGYNDTPVVMREIARTVSTLPTVEKHELIHYCPYGENKYAQIGVPRAFVSLPKVSEERFLKLEKCFRDVGVPVASL